MIVREHEVVGPEFNADEVENVEVAVALDGTSKDMIKESATNTFKEVSTATQIKTEIVVKNVEEAAVPKADIAKIEEQIQTLMSSTKKIEVAQYLDLSILVTADGKELGNITTTELPLTFKVKIPSEFIKEGRTFDVIRVHDGKAEVLKSTMEENIITFATDKFSTYAIIYTDVIEPAVDETPTTPTKPVAPVKPVTPVKPETPVQPAEKTDKGETVDTGDKNAIALYGSICTLAIAVAGIVVLKKKREDALNK